MEKKTFEVRFYLKQEFAKAVRDGADIPELKPLRDILERHNVELHNQLDEFQAFLLKAQKVENWKEAYPDGAERKFLQEMEAFTLSTLMKDEKRAYLSREFTIERSRGKGPFKGNEADALIEDLQTLNDGDGALFGESPRATDRGVRKVYRPKRHPGTTGTNPDILGRF